MIQAEAKCSNFRSKPIQVDVFMMTSFAGDFLSSNTMAKTCTRIGLGLSIFIMASVGHAESNYYQDVRPLIEQNCLGCHSQKGVSFSFEDAKQTYEYRQAIVSAVVEQRMPPWLAEEGHQQYLDDISLSVAQRATFQRWAEGGFALGEEKEYGRGGSANSSASPDLVAGMPFRGDLKMPVLPSEGYLPHQENKDDYRCFVTEWPFEETKYITGFKATPGNTNVAHHLVVFFAEPEVAPHFKAMPDAEENAGYSCFGGAVPDRFADSEQEKQLEEDHPGALARMNDESYWLAHWAPGTNGYAFPEGTGIRMEPGAVLIFQMHYYSVFAPGERDQNTEVEFMLADHVDKPAMVLPLTNLIWLQGKHNESMVIPPNSSRSYQVTEDFAGIAERMVQTSEVGIEEIAQIELHSVNVHMHSYGAAGRTTYLDKNGQKEILINVPRWDLNWQRDFGLVQPKVVDAKDFSATELSVECEFSNATDKPVYGGLGSDDEMCFNFSYLSLVKKPLSLAKRQAE